MLVTIAEVAENTISKNHLMKAAHQLGVAGYIETVRGRHGGLRLAKPAEAITLGEVVRHTEPDIAIVMRFAPTRRIVIPAGGSPASTAWRRIDNRAVWLPNGTWREQREIDAIRAKDVVDALSGANEIIGDDPPVTAPPNRFRAHDGRALLMPQVAELSQTVVELLGQGVVGVVAKARVFPEQVGRGLDPARPVS